MTHPPAPLPGTERRCRLALGVEYDGTAFHGWQRLGHADSVQGTLEAALATIVQHEVEAVCAGRTDAGVHGAEQVVHLETSRERALQAFVMGTNTRLPSSVRVLWAQPVAMDFHARHSARARRYRYRLLNRRMRPALQRDYLSWEPRPLDAGAMHVAAQALVGEHDFNAFRSAQCQATHARRDLHEIAVTRVGEVIEVEVQANAFLHHMVRNIVGSLLMVGRGERPIAWVAELLAGRDRTVAGPTAPPGGLVFLGPRYPGRWGLPASVSLPPDWVERPRPVAVLPDAEQDA